MKNLIEMIERAAEKFPHKIAFSDERRSVTYREFYENSRSVAAAVANARLFRKPVAVMFERSVENLEVMAGVLLSGNFYAVIDCEMPTERIKQIFKTLEPSALLISDSCAEKAVQTGFGGKIIKYSEAVLTEPFDELMLEIKASVIDTDPAYVLFTSGSTGVPKGAVISHRSLISYIRWFSDTFGIDGETVFGSQTPFYFSMSVSDVFSTIYKGATLNIIPKTLFSFPIKLIEFLNERRVNTIYWVPSAMCIIANLKVFDYCKPESLKKVLFAGEVMPVKQLNYWMERIPKAIYANLFGPTETTDICTYYIVDRKFSDTETLPIGKHCDNCDVFVVNENGKAADIGESGELYARGSFLAMGYYNNPEKTAEAFIQNPLNHSYPETVYKTGDLVKYNEEGNLIYLSRKDFQIKHMGYRIELGEIEAAVGAVDRIAACAVVYDETDDKITLFYQGKKITDSELAESLAKRLPVYMMPEVYISLKQFPYNSNGKIDRKLLKENLRQIKMGENYGKAY